MPEPGKRVLLDENVDPLLKLLFDSGLYAAPRAGSEGRARRLIRNQTDDLMEPAQVYHSDPETMSGTHVFTGTRVPVHTLIDHLASGVPLDEFLDDFPTVGREQAVAFLALSEEALIGTDA